MVIFRGSRMRHVADSQQPFHNIQGMLLVLAAAAALTLAGCSGGGGQPYGEEPAAAVSPEMARADLVDAHRALLRAYEGADVEAFVGLMDPSPELLIFHPLHEGRFDGVDEVRDQLGNMFTTLGPAFWSEVHTQASIEGDVGWVSYHLVIQKQGGGEAFVGRGTEVWVRRADGWKLTLGHWSPDPAGE
jgi:hypothetical protein